MSNTIVINNTRRVVHFSNEKWPAIISALMHIAVFIFAIYGLPNVAKDQMPDEMIMTVELFNPSDVIDSANKDKPDKPDEDKETEANSPQKHVYNNSDAVPELVEPKKPEFDKGAEEEVEQVVEKTIEDPTLIKAPPKPKSKPKPLKKAEPKKTPEAKPKENTEPQRDLTSLLKDLTPDDWSEAKNNVNKEDKETDTTSSGNAAASAQMTGNDLSALNQGVQQCWNVNAGGRFAENMVVKLRVIVNRDRTVKEVIIIDSIRYNTDSHYKSAADAAKWALLSPKCSTLNLPPEKYDTWKSFIYVFDPSQML